MSLSLNLYQSMALAVAIFYFGAFLKSKISVFRTYCIPSPVIGGIIYAIVNLILHQTGVLQLSVDTTLQSVFMNVFFTSVGFTAGFGMLKKGGKSLIVFLVAVCILIGIQDVAGAALCKVFGLQPLLGLALGSMPLTGGHGTTTAFAPLLESMGVQNALTVGVAAATYGLVAGNVIGNPLARRRIKKLGLSSSDAAQVDHEALLELKKNTEGTAKLDVDRGTLALALIFLACGLGTLISMLFAKFNITLASYVGSMITGIIIRNGWHDKAYIEKYGPARAGDRDHRLHQPELLPGPGHDGHAAVAAGRSGRSHGGHPAHPDGAHRPVRLFRHFQHDGPGLRRRRPQRRSLRLRHGRHPQRHGQHGRPDEGLWAL